MTDWLEGWRHDVEKFAESEAARPGVRDPERLRLAVAVLFDEFRELTSGRASELQAKWVEAALQLAEAPNDQPSRKRLQKAERAATMAHAEHFHRLGVASLERRLYGTDGDRRLLLLELGVALPGSAFAGASWVEAVQAVGLEHKEAVRRAAILALDEMGVDLRAGDRDSFAELQKALSRRRQAGPSSASLH